MRLQTTDDLAAKDGHSPEFSKKAYDVVLSGLAHVALPDLGDYQALTKRFRAALCTFLRRLSVSEGNTLDDVARRHGLDRRSISRNSTTDDEFLLQKLDERVLGVFKATNTWMTAGEVTTLLQASADPYEERARKQGIHSDERVELLSRRGYLEVEERTYGPGNSLCLPRHYRGCPDIKWIARTPADIFGIAQQIVAEFFTATLGYITEVGSDDHAEKLRQHTLAVERGAATPENRPRPANNDLACVVINISEDADMAEINSAVVEAVYQSLQPYKAQESQAPSRVSRVVMCIRHAAQVLLVGTLLFGASGVLVPGEASAQLDPGTFHFAPVAHPSELLVKAERPWLRHLSGPTHLPSQPTRGAGRQAPAALPRTERPFMTMLLTWLQGISWRGHW